MRGNKEVKTRPLCVSNWSIEEWPTCTPQAATGPVGLATLIKVINVSETCGDNV